ncbi:H(+)-transporting V1 sector ATPase subunit F [Trichoderma cf. simile WF8]
MIKQRLKDSLRLPGRQSFIKPPTPLPSTHPLESPLSALAMASNADFKDRQFLAVIGDEDSVTGLLLAGIGHITAGADAQKNFLVVDNKTETAAIESAFESFTERKDIGIVLINQHVADRIRHRVDTYTAAFPTVLEIPSKDHPYDPEKDSVLRRVRRLFGE